MRTIFGVGNKALDRILWSGQWFVACVVYFTGMVKLGLTADHVRSHYGLAAEATTWTLHTVGLVEVAVSLMAILPAVTRVLPQLSTISMATLGALALFGTALPASMVGTGIAALNTFLAALATLVILGRLAVVLAAPLLDSADYGGKPVSQTVISGE